MEKDGRQNDNMVDKATTAAYKAQAIVGKWSLPNVEG